METSKKQISLFGETKSTSLPEDSLANPTQAQESDSVRRMIDISGRRCLEQFARLSQDGSWERTFADLLIGQRDWYSRRCAPNWKLKGTKYNRSYFQLAVLALPTDEIESGSWLLKTPTKMDGEVSSGKKNPKSGDSGTLAQEVMSKYPPTMSKLGLLPTPMAQSRETDKEKTLKRKEKYGGMKRAMYLENYLAMGMLPTPCTRDYRGANSMDHLQGKNGNKMTHEHQLPNFVKLKTGSNSQLNPQFVAEMMGFPSNWTELPFQSGEKNPSKDMETQ